MARRILMLAALAALAVAPAYAQVNQRKKELSRIQSELRKTLAELEALRSAEGELGRDVSRLEGLDAESRRRVESLQQTIRRAEGRRAELKSRLDSAGRVGEFWTAALSAEAAHHAAAAAGRSDFYGTREIWSEEFRRAAVIEKAQHLRGLKGFQRRTEEAEVVARRRAEELAHSRRRVQDEREGHRREYESKRTELERTQTRVAEATRRAKELEEGAKALTSLLERLGKAGRWRKGGPAGSLGRPRHSLPWPSDGRVLSAFGREQDRELGTWIVRQGVMIGAAFSAPVTAVAPGTVIFTGPFRSYGQVVIVDHGAGFFSVYGQLGDIHKKKGDELRAGEPLARAGGDAAGGRVYLEIRKGTEALDPLEWLEKR